MELRNQPKYLKETDARRAAKMAFNKAFEVLEVREVEKAEREEREKIVSDERRMKVAEKDGSLAIAGRKEIPLGDEEDMVLDEVSSIPSSINVETTTASTTDVNVSNEPKKADAPVEIEPTSPASTAMESDNETTTSPSLPPDTEPEDPAEQSISSESPVDDESVSTEDTTESEQPLSPPDTKPDNTMEKATSPDSTTAAAAIKPATILKLRDNGQNRRHKCNHQSPHHHKTPFKIDLRRH